MNADQMIKRLSAKLGLLYERQDWGIVNATPARVAEFITFYEQEQLAPVERYALEELIIASMNEALVDGLAEKKLIYLFDHYLKTNTSRLLSHIKYWGALENSEEFPIAETLRRFVIDNNVHLE